MRALGVLRLLLMLTVFAGVVVSGHLYLIARLIREAVVGEPLSIVLQASVWALACSLVVQPIGERWLARSIARPLGWIASLWMGFAFLLIVALGASDLVLLVLSPVLEERFEAIEIARTRAGLVAWVVGLAGVVAMRNALRVPGIRRVEVALARWPEALDGFRIAQVSDVHIGPVLDAAFARGVVARVNALEPDLVAVTGDLVDGSVSRLANEVAPFADFRSRHGTYFVTGNHDHYSGALRWSAHLSDLGLRVLRNERTLIEQGGTAFDLAGVDDHHGDMVGGAHEDLGTALAGRDPGRPVVLLAHDPVTFRAAALRDVDLQLSGHTHGGQLFPFMLLVRLVIPFLAGLYRLGESTLYVSRGTGFWGPPMRLGAPAEITELVLRRAA